ncbi:hypothetical protein [Rhodoferax sp.]|uniref:hypothetical protein n=1 Tax=Rhodoferax sp. TaxID=50421 RepID=UPI00374D8DEA
MSALLPSAENAAIDRLVLSRALLRQALEGNRPSRRNEAERFVDGESPAWLENLKSIPVVNVLAEAISGWWMQHPLRIASLLATDTAKAVVLPMAQRNPMGLALAALLIGGMVVWSRPWRWLLKPALFAGLWSQLLSKGIAHLPIHSWMATLTSMALQAHSGSTAKRNTNKNPV